MASDAQPSVNSGTSYITMRITNVIKTASSASHGGLWAFYVQAVHSTAARVCKMSYFWQGLHYYNAGPAALSTDVDEHGHCNTLLVCTQNACQMQRQIIFIINMN